MGFMDDHHYERHHDADIHPRDAKALTRNNWLGRAEASAYALGFLRGVKLAHAAVSDETLGKVLFRVMAQSMLARNEVVGEEECGQ